MEKSSRCEPSPVSVPGGHARPRPITFQRVRVIGRSTQRHWAHPRLRRAGGIRSGSCAHGPLPPPTGPQSFYGPQSGPPTESDNASPARPQEALEVDGTEALRSGARPVLVWYAFDMRLYSGTTRSGASRR